MSRRKNTHPETFLAEIFVRSGCFRQPNLQRRERDAQEYKKGYEVRLTAHTARELAAIRRALDRLGFRLGASYEKHSGFVQPVYGKESLERFRAMIQRVVPDRPTRAH